MSDSMGSRQRILFGEQSAFGTTTTTLTVIPVVAGAVLNLAKETFRSNVLRPDRQSGAVRHGQRNCTGNMPFELRYADFNTMLEGMLFGDWVTSTSALTSTTINITNSNEVVWSSSWVASSFTTYDWVQISGAGESANNVVAEITARTGTTLTLGQCALTTEAAGESITVTRKNVLANGTTRHFYTVQDSQEDSGFYLLGQDLVNNTWDLTIPPSNIVTGNSAWVGADLTPSTTTAQASPTAASSNDPFAGIDASGAVFEGGSAIAYITELRMEGNNNVAPKFAVGNETPRLIQYQRFALSGSATVFFESLALYNKFKNETETSFCIKLTDPDSQTQVWYIPLVKYTNVNKSSDGEGVFSLTLDWQASPDDDRGYTVLVIY
jgi:hypothetical protein